MDNQTNATPLVARFFDNETGFGFLINQPGIDPIIYLNRTLLGEDPSSPLYQQVFNTLQKYHHSLNIWEFVFPFTRFYEEINEPEPVIESEIIILGRFQRAEAHCKVCEAKMLGYRLIG